MPLPLAIMIPFMGMQSGVMAQQFGVNFQYGKRKISAMSNEEFNKLTPEQLQIDFSKQITGMIPTWEQSLKEMRPFQRMIFVEMLAAFKEAVQLGLDVAGAGLGIKPKSPIHPQDPGKFQPPVVQEDPVTPTHKTEPTPSKFSAIQVRLFQQVKNSDQRYQSFTESIRKLRQQLLDEPRAIIIINTRIQIMTKNQTVEIKKLTTLMNELRTRGWFVEYAEWRRIN